MPTARTATGARPPRSDRELSQLAALRQTSPQRRFRARANPRAVVWNKPRSRCAVVPSRGDVQAGWPRCILNGVKGRPCVLKILFQVDRPPKITLLRPGTGALPVASTSGPRVVSTRSAPPNLAPVEVPRPCQYPRRGLGTNRASTPAHRSSKRNYSRIPASLASKRSHTNWLITARAGSHWMRSIISPANA